MGVNIRELLVSKPTSIGQLSGKILVVDAYNFLYQFLSTIRMRDGTLLRDSKGLVTSHLNGLFYRSAHLIQQSIKLGFVFDGEPPELKRSELQARHERKEEAMEKFETAKKKKDIAEMRKYASMTSRLTDEMVDEAKTLIEAMGMPVVQAPSEGEAQASHMVKNGDAYAVASQDYDCLMFGTPRLVRNLSVAGRRKIAGKAAYKEVEPEIIYLDENLERLGLDNDQLIALGMLIGTDYNPRGVKGIGPKKALKLVLESKADIKKLFESVAFESSASWEEVFSAIKNTRVTKEYSLKWKPVNEARVLEILCGKHDFSEERVKPSLQRIKDLAGKDKSLASWFG